MLSTSTFTNEKGQEVLEKTLEYLDKNPAVNKRIQDLSAIYHALHHVIPITTDNFWSGHNFPYRESWEEIQISYNLACLGLYKQSMTSLRSALELGLLSVYYNINDDGHNFVQKWLSSDDSKDSDTPKRQDVWNILLKHENIKKFQKKIDIYDRILKLNYLHNYVHTKGFVFSNQLGKFKSNSQTFEQDHLDKWLNALEEIVIIIVTLHILKYPMAIVKFDYSKKFGIDVPQFSRMYPNEIDRLEMYLPKDYIKELEEIAATDSETLDFMDWLLNQPDISRDDIEEQIIELDKLFIKKQGIESYKKDQLVIYRVDDYNSLPVLVLDRIKKLEDWLLSNNQ